MSFLINGLYRSGTTLLQKLLCNHPELSVPYQKTLNSFIEAKKAFYQTIDHPESYYYLGPCFYETRYRTDDLNVYLNKIGFAEKLEQAIHQASYNPNARITGRLMQHQLLVYAGKRNYPSTSSHAHL